MTVKISHGAQSVSVRKWPSTIEVVARVGTGCFFIGCLFLGIYYRRQHDLVLNIFSPRDPPTLGMSIGLILGAVLVWAWAFIDRGQVWTFSRTEIQYERHFSWGSRTRSWRGKDVEAITSQVHEGETTSFYVAVTLTRNKTISLPYITLAARDYLAGLLNVLYVSDV